MQQFSGYSLTGKSYWEAPLLPRETGRSFGSLRSYSPNERHQVPPGLMTRHFYSEVSAYEWFPIVRMMSALRQTAAGLLL